MYSHHLRPQWRFGTSGARHRKGSEATASSRMEFVQRTHIGCTPVFSRAARTQGVMRGGVRVFINGEALPRWETCDGSSVAQVKRSVPEPTSGLCGHRLGVDRPCRSTSILRQRLRAGSLVTAQYAPAPRLRRWQAATGRTGRQVADAEWRCDPQTTPRGPVHQRLVGPGARRARHRGTCVKYPEEISFLVGVLTGG